MVSWGLLTSSQTPHPKGLPPLFQRGMATAMSYIYPSYGMFEIKTEVLSRDPEEVNTVK